MTALTAAPTTERASVEEAAAGKAVRKIDPVWASCSVLAAILLSLTFWLPLWKMNLIAPQYPRGLDLTAYGTTMKGDLQEINTLNHYVGIQKIEPDSVTELQLFPYVLFAFVAVLLVGAFLARKRWQRIALAAVAWAFPIGMLVDLQYWLYTYGHDLHPDAPMRIPDFTPKVLGETKVVNFHTQTEVSIGWWAMLGAALLLSVVPLLIRFVMTAWSNTGTPKAAGGAAAAFLLLGALALGNSGSARAAADFSINDAIAQAQPGDTITVPAGTYHENVKIDKPVTLIGVGWPVLDAGEKGDVVHITAEGVTLRGFVIQGSARNVVDEPAGIRVNGDNAVIEGNRLQRVLYGITIQDSKGARVLHNELSSYTEYDSERRGHAIYLYSTSDNVIEHNRVNYAKDGVFMGFATNNSVRHNTVTNVRYGIHFMYADDNEFVGNIFKHSVAGGALMYSRGITLRDNDFSENRSRASGYGLLLKDVSDVTIENNRIHHNRLGITLEGAPDRPEGFVRISHNLIGYNQIAMEVTTTTSAVLTENTFIANLAQVETKGGNIAAKNTWSVDGRGNYWDEYQGYDANGNGVGDIPYRYEGAFDDLVRKNESLRAFSYTPARAALDLAAKWFPVYRPEARVVDNDPLMSPTMSLTSTSTSGDRAAAIGVVALLALVPLAGFGLASRSLQRGWRASTC